MGNVFTFSFLFLAVCHCSALTQLSSMDLLHDDLWGEGNWNTIKYILYVFMQCVCEHACELLPLFPLSQLLVDVYLGDYFKGNYGNGLVWLCFLLGPPLAMMTYFHDHYMSHHGQHPPGLSVAECLSWSLSYTQLDIALSDTFDKTYVQQWTICRDSWHIRQIVPIFVEKLKKLTPSQLFIMLLNLNNQWIRHVMNDMTQPHMKDMAAYSLYINKWFWFTQCYCKFMDYSQFISDNINCWVKILVNHNMLNWSTVWNM